MTANSSVTFRTTGLMLKAISDALLFPGTWIEFEIDRKHTVESAKLWQETLEALASQLSLRGFRSRTEGNRVFVMMKAIG